MGSVNMLWVGVGYDDGLSYQFCDLMVSEYNWLCWLCGGIAAQREHVIIADMFPSVDQS